MARASGCQSPGRSGERCDPGIDLVVLSFESRRQ
jgi:hypothetical protein